MRYPWSQAIRLDSRGKLHGDLLWKCPKNLGALADDPSHASRTAHCRRYRRISPSKNLVPQSERYIMGPEGLKANAPDIPASAVGFAFWDRRGNRALPHACRSPNVGRLFISPAIHGSPATSRISEDRWSSVKRTGPLVAVAFGPGTGAAKLLNEINYQGVVRQEREATREAARAQARKRRKDGSVHFQLGRPPFGFLLTIGTRRGRHPPAGPQVWLLSC